MQKNVKKLARAGIIAALYTVLTLIVFPVASGAVQIRISEALTLLPLLFIEAIPALAVGCFISNLITGCAAFDMAFGTLITLVAAMLTYFSGKFIKNIVLKVFIGGLFPVVLNALLLPLIWVYCYGAIEYVYYIQALLLVLGQGVSVYLFGTPVLIKLSKSLKE